MAFKLSPRDQMIAVGVGALLILVLSVLLILMPQFNRLSSLSVEQKVEQDNLEQAKLKLQRLDAIRQEATDVEAKRISLLRRLPEDAELPSLIVELQKIANAAGLDFGSVRIEDVTDLQGYAEVPFSLTVTGTFYSVIDYFYRLEKMSREVVIDSFSLAASDYPDLNVEIKARVFKTSEPAVALPPPGETTSTGGGQATGTGN